MSMTPLVDICKKITSGGTPSRDNPGFYTGNIPWIKTGELKSWYINSTEEKITEEAIDKSSAKIYPVNTVLLAMYGDGRTIGSVGITGVEAASNQACCALITDPNQCDPLFLLYSLQHHRREIVSLALGASQRNLNQTTIKNFKIRFPKIEEQKEISFMLSQFDYLIENNQRRIRILEDMAQSLYREWFVHFRFPGHEKTKMTDSPLGPIPQGWEVRELGQSVTFIKETTKPKDLQPHYKYLPIDCLPRKCLSVSEYRPLEEAQSSLVLFKREDILFGAMRPYFHKVVISPFDGVTRATCFVFRPLSEEYRCWSLLRLFQDETVDYANAHSKGATIPYASWEDGMARMPVVLPPSEVARKFEEAISFNIDWIINAHHRQESLKKARDLLLPKLISGEIDLSAAASHLAEAA